ncbi:alpha-D-ribose 1-methylphosphonate 5-triphosphate diphosphatase [Malaciobacter mytili]|uniref:Alpha-D-ribose 1-methylphosphonate 5-triphosphate diphosphatase n=1 Tax=Malaciobacter mytili LMG 24559 TaxID=1032238 RepID=A0AAX2AFP4_9BACT|nr:alpha-D-ribose 1-methylphosphonate 5-triphosphate diphosphatase [Malaciobacter mytili]AXH14976.1 RPnTP hydrolase [Malaciobacter mytili LMG 24559]RXI37568.1 alpha-D-ribose 1-methylphosphonate 5-triphosphate diphosphatase [Malaciobacter mytili]RXK12406.1 alpha-D-ribose 1-methylphosphonate 5-triphosphate diphosphatase [Malaciobacter mytili LMG 24559]
MQTILRSSKVLINEEFIPADIVIEGEFIKRVDKYGINEVAIDLKDKKVTPGIVDLHSDALEKEIEPRPNATFPMLLAITELDKKLSMAGVTTMFHAIGFEENPKKKRSIDLAKQQIEEIYKANKNHLGVDNLIHARFELSATDAVEPIKEVISKKMVNLVSLMDHSPGQGQFKTLESFKSYYSKYYGLNDDEVDEIANKKINKDEEKIKELINYAKKYNLTLLSHDDDCIEKLDGLLNLGVQISEFPLSLEVAKYAVSKAIATGMGAPNIVRGGSQGGNIAAIDLVKEGVCKYLCSDYHPTSMLQAVYKMKQDANLDLAKGFSMITSTPAKYANLEDRGEIKEGKRADIIVIDDSYIPKVILTIKDGESIYNAIKGFKL